MNLLVVAATAALLFAPREFSASTADLRLPVPASWRLDANAHEPTPSVPAPGMACTNSIWFDFIPGATVAYTRQLIDTESLEATAAIRHWSKRRQSEIRLASRPAVRLDFPDLPRRTVFFLSAGGGALVVQTMATGDVPDGCTGSHAAIAGELVTLFFAPTVIAKAEQLTRTRKPPPLNKIEPIPRNLEECFEALKKKLAAKDLDRFRAGSEKDLVRYHHGFGTGLRNRWGLWGESPLAQYFNAMGIHHPDDMSGIILKSFWRHLNGRPLQVEQQAAYYRRYWAVRKEPEPATCEDGSRAVRLFQLCNRRETRAERCVHAFACGAKQSYRVWELEKGWYAPDQRLRKLIAKRRAEHADGLIEAPLDE